MSFLSVSDSAWITDTLEVRDIFTDGRLWETAGGDASFAVFFVGEGSSV